MFIQTLLLLLLPFVSGSSVDNLTDDSVDLCSNHTLNFSNYTPLKFEVCGCEICVRKCCRSGFYYYNEGGQLSGRCLKSDSLSISVPIYDIDKKIKDLNYGFSIGMINCTNHELAEVNLELRDSVNYFYIQQDGSWYYPHLDISKNNTDYCVNARNGKTTYYYCKDLVDEKVLFRRAASTIPAPFLLTTALVYIILPKRTIYTKALILHTVCLAFCNILIAVDQYDIMESVIICKALGSLMMYSWYASIFWMNVMCIDIWLTFSGLNDLRRRLGKENLLFIVLNIYAWGIAGVYMLVIRLFDVSRASPAIYNQGCFKIVLPSYWFYFSTITFFTVLNTTFYILTTINIRKAKREAAVLNCAASGRHISRSDEKFTLYWNLFWVMSTLSALYYLRLVHMTLQKREWYNSPGFDIFVHAMFSMYSVVIFIVFVCKKKIWRELKERYRYFLGKLKVNKSSTSTAISSKSPSVITVSNVHLTSFKNINR